MRREGRYVFVEGTRICPVPYQSALEPPTGVGSGSVLDDCVRPSVEGVVRVAGDCLLIEGPGEGAWVLDLADRCPYGEVPGLAADRLPLLGVAHDDLRLDVRTALEETAGLEDAGGGTVPDDIGVDDTLRVLADQRVELRLLVVDAAGQTVAWSHRDAEVRLDGGTARVIAGATVSVEVPSGADTVLRLDLPSGSLDPLRIVAVEPADLASVDIVAPLARWSAEGVLGEAGADLPEVTWVPQAWAVYRDTEGRVVWGVPTRWENNGDRVLLTRRDDEGGTSLEAEDVCESIEPGRHWWWVRATADLPGVDLQATERLRYRYPRRTLDALDEAGEIDLDDPDFAPDEDCPTRQPVCGCSAAGSPLAGGLLGVLGALMMLRRRRP